MTEATQRSGRGVGIWNPMSAAVGRTLLPVTDAELQQTAAIFRRLLTQVESGQIGITGERDVALLRRIEGAAGALEAASEGTGALPAELRQEGGGGKRAES
jgi:hypothetical protein